MSQVANFGTHITDPAPRGPAALVRILLGAAAISAVAGVAAVTLLDGLVGANEMPRLVPAPPTQASLALAPDAVSGSTTVPDAATALAGREPALEEPAPTF